MTTQHRPPRATPLLRMTLAKAAATLLLGILLCVITGIPANAVAATAGTPAADAQRSPLHAPRQQLETIQAELQQATTDEALNQLRQQTMLVYNQVRDYAQSLAPKLTDLQSRLTELGDAPTDHEEDTETAQQRADLNTQIGQLESQTRLANLLTLDSEQTLEAISSQRRAQFQTQLWQRSPSILTGRFWSALRQNHNLDTQRGEAIWQDIQERLASVPHWLWLALLAWAVFVLVLLRAIGSRLRTLAAEKVPAGRLRRCLHVWSQALLATVSPFLLFGGIYLALSWFSPLPESIRVVFAGLIGVTAYCGYTAGLGHALLAPKSASWRLPPIQDATAKALQHLPFALALMLALSWLAEQANQLVNTRLSLSILTDSVFSLLVIAIFAIALYRTTHIRRHYQADGTAPSGTGTWIAQVLNTNRRLIEIALWAALAFALVNLLLGYVVFAKFLLQQLVWSLTVVSTAYLLSATVSDVAALLTKNARARVQSGGDAGQATLPAQQVPLKKWIVLGAGLAQASIGLLALLLLFASFNQESFGFMGHLQYLQGNLKWGEVEIRPLAVVQALVLFLAGAALIHVVKGWLAERFFPATGLDVGVQASLSTLLSYAAYVVVFAMALSVTGVGFERVTWIASALSVGIGFGLQAIVQNFVSGLILLAERPVKVGDWVSLSGIEGDIRRINVRATEIQMSDRSTVIVPNSEFVTKMVRNITYADSLGRIQIKLSMPLDTPAADVREIIQTALKENDNILADPAPNVFLDDITSANLVFNALAFVSSPRLAYRTRSALLFDILQRLKAANIATSSPTSLVLTKPAAPAESGNKQDLPA